MRGCSGSVLEMTTMDKLCRAGKLQLLQDYVSQLDDAALRAELNSRAAPLGYTPLHVAALNGHAPVLKLLLSKGGDVNCRANGGFTPLHLAAGRGHVRCVRVLVSHGADKTIKDDRGRTPIDLADRSTKNNVAAAIISEEIVSVAARSSVSLEKLLNSDPPSQFDPDCLSRALMVAVKSDHVANVSMLVRKGATNLDEALLAAKLEGKVRSRALLLLVKAALSNDVDLLLNLYGPPKSSTDDNFHDVQLALAGGQIPTDVPVEIAGRYGNTAVREELMLRRKMAPTQGLVLWHALHLSVLDLEWLQRTPGVLHLCLDHNNLQMLPSNIGSAIQQVVKLEFQFNQLETIPASLLQLPCLSELNLSYNKLRDLPLVPHWSPSLTTLDLSHNHLTTIPGEPTADSIDILNLSHNKLDTVPPCIFNFLTLCSLDLSYNGIAVLPEVVGRLRRLTTLNLAGLSCARGATKVEGGPARGVSQLLGDASSNYHLKVVVLGEKGVGKSTLVSLITDTEFKEDPVTVGIRICAWEVPLKEQPLVLNMWDFTHLDPQHYIYQCFLTMETMYLLLFDARHSWDTVGEGIEPWLEALAQRVEQSCVLVVGTHQDLLPVREQHDEVDLTLREVTRVMERYSYRLQVAGVMLVSLQGGGESLELLKEAICSRALAYSVRGTAVVGQRVPSSYHRAREMAAEMCGRVSRGECDPVMDAEEYRAQAEDAGIRDVVAEDQLEEMAAYLTRVGPLVHFRSCHANKTYFFLDPGWLYRALCAIVAEPSVSEGGLRTSQVSLSSVPHAQRHTGTLLSLLEQNHMAVTLSPDLLLITSLLLPSCPEGVCVSSIGGRWPYMRYILLGTTPTPGFWTHLLSSVVQAVPRVQSVADEQWGNCPLPAAGSGDRRAPPSDATALVYFWRTGVHYQDLEVAFRVESLSHSGQLTHERKEGVLIVVSATDLGKTLIGQLVDMATAIINNCYLRDPQHMFFKPALSQTGYVSMEETIPCSACIRMGRPLPFEFQLEHCLSVITQGKEAIECDCITSTYGQRHITALADLAPDLVMADIEAQYHLDVSSLCIQDDSVVATGTPGVLCLGAYRCSPVVIRKYAHKDCSYDIRCLRREVLLLQGLDHPCVVRLVGICTQTLTRGLVLEHAPLGQLDIVLSEHKLHRVTLHRLASEVGAALIYLHERKIILFNLRASGVLVWSLHPEHICHCKVASLHAARCAPVVCAPAWAQAIPPPEAMWCNGWGRCDHKADMFSFGMLLYHMVTGQEPFHKMERQKVLLAIKRGRRPRLETPHPQSFPYLIKLLQQCWDQSPDRRPCAEEAVERLCLSSTQSVVAIAHMEKMSLLLQSSCLVTHLDLAHCNIPSQDSEVWFCIDGEEGTSIKTYSMATMTVTKMNFVVENQVQSMSVCGDHVWVSSCAGVDCGSLDLFHIGTKEMVHTISTGEAIVSCIASSERFVYCGTIEGRCLVFSRDVHSLRAPREKVLSDHAVEGIVSDGECLWVSTASSILFLNLCTLTTAADTLVSRQGFVGQLKLSPDKVMVWSFRLGAAYLSAWGVGQKCHLFDVAVQDHLKGISSCAEQDMVITAITLAMDTVWVGMATGHILIFHKQELLLWFHPCNSHIKFLHSYEGFTGSGDEAKETSGGGKVMYVISASSGFHWPNPQGTEDRGGDSDAMETLITWEAFPSNLCRQMYLLDRRSATFCEDHHFVAEMLQKGLFVHAAGVMAPVGGPHPSVPRPSALEDCPKYSDELESSTSLLLSYSYATPAVSTSRLP